jgi:hypothetical protein
MMTGTKVCLWVQVSALAIRVAGIENLAVRHETKVDAGDMSYPRWDASEAPWHSKRSLLKSA